MEFWEGAVLIIGGVWFVGRMHRTATATGAMAPGVAAPVGMPSHRVPGPTSETNTDGSGYLVSGESLGTGLTNPTSNSCPSCNLGGGLPGLRGPRSAVGGSGNFRAAGATPMSKVQRPMAVQF